MAEIQSPLGMDDEEFLKQDLSQLEAELIAAEETAEEVQETTDQIDTPEEEQTSEEVASEDEEVTPDEVDPYEEAEESESNTEESEEEISEDEVADLEEDIQLEAETLEDAEEPESEDTDATENTETAKQKKDTSKAEIDYEEAYKRIMAPFKASKRMMQVDNIDDAISLMQKGADYHNKMKTLSPNLKIVSTLEKEGLLDQAKLNNLIDLSKKDPKAIAQLIKESGIDPLDIDTDEEVRYKPNNYGVSDKEFRINQAIDEIKDSPSFDKTINVLAKEWDNESKNIISDNPEIISIINDHVFNGVFDKVQGIVDTERALGRLNVPDVVAYRQVAENLQAQGGIVQEGVTQPPSKPSVPKTKAQDPVVVQQKRKAAAGTRKTTSKTSNATSNYLGMTDEEFMKLADV
tara:strand:+ start:6414 stop:7631 length:1218 start_codon:yes stop_codon:yes gene_type:complete